MGYCEQKEKLITYSFLKVIFASFITGTYSIMLMITVMMYGNYMGYSPVIAAILSSIYAFAALIVRPFTGFITDRYSKKTVFLAGMFTLIVAPFAFIFQLSVMLKLMLRFLSGAGMALSSTAIGAIATEIIPKARFTEGIGHYTIGMALSSALAPFLGLKLIEYYGYTGMFIAGSMAVAVAFCLILHLEYHKFTKGRPKVSGFKDFVNMTYDEQAVFPSMSSFLLTTAHISITHFLPSHISQLGGYDASRFFIFMAVGSLLPRLFSGLLRAVLSDEMLLYFGYSTLICCFMWISFMKNWGLTLLLGGIVYGIGHGMSGMLLNSMAVINAAPESTGAANATYWFAGDMGFAIAPLAWNVYCSISGYTKVYYVSAVIVFLNLISYVIYRKYTP